MMRGKHSRTESAESFKDYSKSENESILDYLHLAPDNFNGTDVNHL